MKPSLFLAVGMAAVAVITGCGGSGKEAPTKDAFLKQANAICKKRTHERQRLVQEQINGEPSEEKLKDLIAHTILPSFETMVEEIGELDAPVGEKGEVAKVIEGLEEAGNTAERDPTDPVIQKANEGAQKYGLKQCQL